MQLNFILIQISSSYPQLQLRFDSTVMASTLTGLPLHTLLDTEMS